MLCACCKTRVAAVSYRRPPSKPPRCPSLRGGVSFGNGARDSGLTLMGARVVRGGGIGSAVSPATVVGSETGGAAVAVVCVTGAVRPADVLTVAGRTGTGCSVTAGGGALRTGGDVDAAVDTGVESAGITTCDGMGSCSSATAVAAAAASVARTTPVRTIRRDDVVSPSGAVSVRRAASWPSPASRRLPAARIGSRTGRRGPPSTCRDGTRAICRGGVL